jgi:hypothetical protein
VTIVQHFGVAETATKDYRTGGVDTYNHDEVLPADLELAPLSGSDIMPRGDVLIALKSNEAQSVIDKKDKHKIIFNAGGYSDPRPDTRRERKRLERLGVTIHPLPQVEVPFDQ